jgi:hypothetical protein
MTQKKYLIFFLAVTLFTSVISNAQNNGTKLILVKGQKLQIDNVVKSLTNMDMMGQSMEMTSDASMTHQVEVKDTKAANYTVASTITKITSSGNAMGQAYTFDSDKKEDLESEIGKAMKGELNVTHEADFNTSGNVVSEKAAATAEAQKGNAMMDMMKNLTGGGSDDGGGAGEIFQVLPKGKKPGDSWTDSTIAEGSKTYKTYTLKEIKGNDAILTLSGTQSTNKKIEQQGMEVNVTMESKLSGESTVDLTTGIVKQKSLVMDGAGNADAMGQAIPITTKITSSTIVKNL